MGEPFVVGPAEVVRGRSLVEGVGVGEGDADVVTAVGLAVVLLEADAELAEALEAAAVLAKAPVPTGAFWRKWSAPSISEAHACNKVAKTKKRK